MIDELRRQYHSQLQVDVETGVGDATTTDPQMMLRWSDDGGHTWTAERQASMGAIGQYGQRVIWRRLGSPRDRVYEISGTDPVKVTVIGAYLEIVDGRH